MRDIIAIGGAGFLSDPGNLALEKYLLDQSDRDRPSVLMIATARGDDAAYVEQFHAAFAALGAKTQYLPFFHRTPDLRSIVLAQNVIYVGGGNTKSMLAVWRDWGLPEILADAYDAGIALCPPSTMPAGRARGLSAGSSRASPIHGPIVCGRSTAWACCPAAAARITTVKPSGGRRTTR